MTVQEIVTNSIHQLKTILLRGNVLGENISDPLKILRDQLQQIDNEPESMSMDAKRQLILVLKSFEINLVRQLIVRFSSDIPPPVLIALFDTIRLQIFIDMKINPLVSDRYFDLSLTQLTDASTIDYLVQRESRPENIIHIDEHFLNLFCCIGSRSLFIKSELSYSICVSRRKTPTFFQLTDATDRLLRAFIIYLNSYFLNNGRQNQSHISLLKWLLNMTDIYGFVPYFVETGYPGVVLQWMTIARDREEQISGETWFLVINLLHNLAQHWTGVKALNKLKAIPILKEWKDQHISESSPAVLIQNHEDIFVAYYLVYAILLEPKQLKNEDMSDIQKVLDQILEQTVQAFDSPELRCGPYNVCEYLTGLAKFVVNDKFLLYIISRDNMFELFVRKFLEFNQLCISNVDLESTDLNTLICASLYTIFWSISFQSEYHCKLKAMNEFIAFVQQISKTETDDEHALVMKRAAKGILFNLDLVQLDVEPIQDIKEDNGIKVMISYAHKDTTFCRKLVSYLQGRVQGDIWVDFMKLSPPYEDDWEEIASAITQCDVVLMIVTENYCSSKSCRREVIHADKRNKRMVPVYLGKEYQPEDWFEIRVGSATWVRFSDKKSDEEATNTLLGLINVRDKVKQRNYGPASHQIPSPEKQQQIVPSTIPEPMIGSRPVLTPPHSVSNPMIEMQSAQPLQHPITPDIAPTLTIPSTLTKPIEQWNSTEVEQWLHLPPSVLHLSSGRALLAYIHLLANEDAQLDEYERKMRDHGVSREQFANLISSFMTLRSLHSIESTLTKPPEQWTYEEVKCWFYHNHLSDYLFDTFGFIHGDQLITYAKLLIDSPARINAEYDRLRTRIQTRCNGNDLLHLDEYVRLVNALKKLVARSQQLSSLVKQESLSCTIS